MADPFHRREAVEAIGVDLREAASWLVDLLFERTSASRAAGEIVPIEARATRLARGRRIAFTSLIAGCGTTTTAALVAQRSGGGGARVRLVDLDLVAPTLALLAGNSTPNVADVLGAEAPPRGRRWGSVEALFGTPLELGPEGGPTLAALVRRCATDAAVVVDAGTAAAPTCVDVLRACDQVLYVATPRAAHVQAAVRGAALFSALGIGGRLVLTRCEAAAAAPLADEIGLPLAAAIPEDLFLSRDEFRVRAETARAIDALCASLAP